MAASKPRNSPHACSPPFMETENPESEVTEPVPSQVLTPGSPLSLSALPRDQKSPPLSFHQLCTPLHSPPSGCRPGSSFCTAASRGAPHTLPLYCSPLCTPTYWGQRQGQGGGWREAERVQGLKAPQVGSGGSPLSTTKPTLQCNVP